MNEKWESLGLTDVIDARSEVFSLEQRARTQALYHAKELIGPHANPVSQYRELARWIVYGDEAE